MTTDPKGKTPSRAAFEIFYKKWCGKQYHYKLLEWEDTEGYYIEDEPQALFDAWEAGMSFQRNRMQVVLDGVYKIMKDGGYMLKLFDMYVDKEGLRAYRSLARKIRDLEELVSQYK
jgi:hypothetical protein